MAGLLMRRLPRKELVERLAGSLRREQEFSGRGRDLLATGERVSTIAGRLADLIDGTSMMVIQTDAINAHGLPGRWGIDEPDPAGLPRPPMKVI